MRHVKFLVSPVGIEPTTNWLKANCSTTELRAHEIPRSDSSPLGKRLESGGLFRNVPHCPAKVASLTGFEPVSPP